MSVTELSIVSETWCLFLACKASFSLLLDHADEILQKSFVVGTTTSIETSSYISETLQLLNLETVQI